MFLLSDLHGCVTGIGGLPLVGQSALDFIASTTPVLTYAPESARFSIFRPLQMSLDLLESNGLCTNKHIELTFVDSISSYLSSIAPPPRVSATRALKCQVVGPQTALYGISSVLSGRAASKSSFINHLADWYEAYFDQVSSWIGDKDLGRIVVVDEPLLSVEHISSLATVYQRIRVAAKRNGLLLGVHCCATTGWAERVKALVILDPDIISIPFCCVNLIAIQPGFHSRHRLLIIGIIDPEHSVIVSEYSLEHREPNEFHEMFVREISKIPRAEELSFCWSPTCGLGLQTSERSEAVFFQIKNFVQSFKV